MATDSSFRRLADRCWQLLVVAAAVALVGYLVVWLKVIVVPLLFGLFAAAVFAPPVAWLRRQGWPSLLATWTVLLGAAALLVGLGLALAPGIIADLDQMGASLEGAIEQIEDFLAGDPFNLSRAELSEYAEALVAELEANASRLITGALGGAVLVVEVVGGAALAAVATFFFLKDGDRMVAAGLDLVPDEQRDRVERIGARGWHTISSYLRGVVVIGVVNAVAVGIALLVLGVPLVLPLMLLMFVGAFFPLAGAFVSGLVAVLVALASNGLIDAVILAAVVVGVQQVEGDVLAPLVLGKAVALHPLVVLVSLVAGAVIGGVLGAFFAVPVVAVASAALSQLREPLLDDTPEEIEVA